MKVGLNVGRRRRMERWRGGKVEDAKIWTIRSHTKSTVDWAKMFACIGIDCIPHLSAMMKMTKLRVDVEPVAFCKSTGV